MFNGTFAHVDNFVLVPPGQSTACDAQCNIVYQGDKILMSPFGNSCYYYPGEGFGCYDIKDQFGQVIDRRLGAKLHPES